MPNREDYQLRTMTEADLEMVLNWRNSERIRANMYTDHIIVLEEHQDWYERAKDNPSCQYLICEFKGQAIGLVYFTNIDNKNNRCYWGFYLGETQTGLGAGTAMEFLALEHSFEGIKIRKLCCEVLDLNAKVIKLHKKFQFKEEGIFKAHIYKNEQYQDVICLALFREDWLEHKNNLFRTVFRT